MSKDGLCPICHEPIAIIVRCGKFVNDKNYEEICYTCFSCIKTCGPINNDPNNTWNVYDDPNTVHLYTKKEMQRYGWVNNNDQYATDHSLKSIKGLLKKAGKKIVQEDIAWEPEPKIKKKKKKS